MRTWKSNKGRINEYRSGEAQDQESEGEECVTTF